MRAFRIFTLTFVISLALSVFAQPQGEREFTANGYTPGQQYLVQIRVTGEAEAVTVTETPPEGWTVGKIASSGTLQDGVIVWELTSLSGSKSIRYYARAGIDSTGDAIFSGQVNGIEITGHTVIPQLVPGPGKQVPVISETHYNYQLYLPLGYGEQERKWPLMMFLHGAGERGSDLELVKVHGPPKLVESGESMEQVFGGEFNYVLVSPQCPASEWWRNEQLIPILDEIIAEYSIDTSRVYLTGLSMGGFGTWSLGKRRFPIDSRRLAPICGGGDAWAMAAWLVLQYFGRSNLPRIHNVLSRDAPIWAFHGDADPTVPIQLHEQIVNAVLELGGDVTFTVYPGVDHDSWTQTYNNPELYEWFMRHQRSAASASPRWELYN